MFQVGQAVEFTDRKGRVQRGAVVKFNGNRRRPRYGVQTEAGMWGVPESMLRGVRPGALYQTPSALVERGREFEEKRRKNRETRNAARLPLLADRCSQFRRDQEVDVWNARFGWMRSVVVAVYPELGKVRVVSPKRWDILFGLPYGSDKSETVTVLADRVRVRREK